MAVHGTSADGAAITDEAVEVMADEAEQGYYVGAIQRRRGGRPPIGSAASSVESVRLDPELKRELLCAPRRSTSASRRRSVEPSASTSEHADHDPSSTEAPTSIDRTPGRGSGPVASFTYGPTVLAKEVVT